MKCPFRKITSYQAQEDSGRGYAYTAETYEFFDDCIGKECAAFVKVEDLDLNTKVDFCRLCNNDC